MGADFALYALPLCNMTDVRTKQLKQCLDAIADEDLGEMLCDHEEPHQRVHEAIDFLVGMADGRRDVRDFYLPGMPYPLWVTGGMSWGDFPTDAAAEFAFIAECSQLFAQLEEWAKQDLASSPLQVSDSTHSGETH